MKRRRIRLKTKTYPLKSPLPTLFRQMFPSFRRRPLMIPPRDSIDHFYFQGDEQEVLVRRYINPNYRTTLDIIEHHAYSSSWLPPKQKLAHPKAPYSTVLKRHSAPSSPAAPTHTANGIRCSNVGCANRRSSRLNISLISSSLCNPLFEVVARTVASLNAGVNG